MNDLYMVLLLAGTFLVFYAFLVWCDRIVDESGGERK